MKHRFCFLFVFHLFLKNTFSVKPKKASKVQDTCLQLLTKAKLRRAGLWAGPQGSCCPGLGLSLPFTYLAHSCTGYVFSCPLFCWDITNIYNEMHHFTCMFHYFVLLNSSSEFCFEGASACGTTFLSGRRHFHPLGSYWRALLSRALCSGPFSFLSKHISVAWWRCRVGGLVLYALFRVWFLSITFVRFVRVVACICNCCPHFCWEACLFVNIP